MAAKIGFFIDNAVANIQYYTASVGSPSVPALTGPDGAFRYATGEQVTFMIGSLSFPVVAAKPTLTLLDLFSTTDVNDQRVVNAARLLLSLDRDGNSNNGIQIDSLAFAAASAIDFSLSDSAFSSDAAVNNLLANSGSSNTSLVSASNALNHLNTTLANFVNKRTTLVSTGANSADARPAFNAAFGGTAYEDQSIGSCAANANPPLRLTEVVDASLGKSAFAFHIVRDSDIECVAGKLDRQRLEVKVYNASPAELKATEGEWHSYRWKFKLPAGFQVSTSFTHIFQVKASGGSDDDDPVITITPRRASSQNRLDIIHGAGNGTGYITLATGDLAVFVDRWIDAHVRVLNRDDGYFEIALSDAVTGELLLSQFNNNIDMWRAGADINRPKWGIYRGFGSAPNYTNKASLRDETLLFDDFCIAEGTNICPFNPVTPANASSSSSSAGANTSSSSSFSSAASSVALSSEASASSESQSSTQSSSEAASSSSLALSSSSSATLTLLHGYDFEGNGNDLVTSGALNLSTAGGSPSYTQDGISGKSATFNGAQFLRNTDSTLGFLKDDQYTLSFWVNFSLLPAEGVSHVLLEQINTSGDKGGFRIYTRQSSGNITLRYRVLDDASADVEALSSASVTPLATAQWYQVVAVYNAGSMKLFINGALVDSKTIAANVRVSPAAADSLSIGGQTTNTSSTTVNLTGSIDSVRIYRGAKTDSEVLADYNATKP